MDILILLRLSVIFFYCLNQILNVGSLPEQMHSKRNPVSMLINPHFSPPFYCGDAMPHPA
jgi:hypothetical protein